MQFDLNKLMEDPNFISGIGLLGSSSKQTEPLLTAYDMLRKHGQQKQINERHQMEMAQEREKNRIYNIQIETQRRNAETEALLQQDGKNLTEAFLKKHGYLPDGAAIPQPNATPTAQPIAPIAPTPVPKVNFNGSPEKVATQHLFPQAEAKMLSALLEKNPVRRIQIMSEALQGQASETRQINQETRAAEAADRAARAEGRAETAAERAARAELRSEERFNRLERVAAAREHATGVLRGEKSSSPVAAAKESKLSMAELKREDAEKKTAKGKEDVYIILGKLRDAYTELQKSPGGITDTEKGPLGNIRAGAESSLPGQAIGKVLGTKNQSARNTINMTRPLLLQALKKATDITGAELNSNADVKMYLQASSDPSYDVQANLKALEHFQQLYGDSSKQISPTVAPKGLPQGWKVERVQ